MKTTLKIFVALFALVGIFLTWLVWPILHLFGVVLKAAPRVMIILFMLGLATHGYRDLFSLIPTVSQCQLSGILMVASFLIAVYAFFSEKFMWFPLALILMLSVGAIAGTHARDNNTCHAQKH